MKKFKKLLAMLTALTVAISLVAIAPVMAEEGEAPELTPAQQLWHDTNLVINGNFENLTTMSESGAFSNDPSGVGYWSKAGNISSVSLATNQAYSGEKSVYIERASGNYYAIYYPNVYTGNNTMKTNTTYIGNYKILGTTANKNYAGREPLTSIIMDSNEYAWSGYGPSFMTFSTSTLDITADDFAVASKPGEEGPTNLPQSAWKELTTILTINDTLPGAIGFGIHQPDNTVNSSFYVDDFYLGELIVAEVENATEKTEIDIPVLGSETVTLNAKAYNQLGTEEGLEGTTYTYSLVNPVAGVSISDNVLTVSNEAQAQTVQIEVTANPVFKGADNQSENVKALRKSIISIKLAENTGFKFKTIENNIIATAIVGKLDSDAKAYCAVYQVADGAKKLMSLESKDVVVGSEDVTFTAISTPGYTYEIKCFMWYKGTMKNVVPAAVFPQN